MCLSPRSAYTQIGSCHALSYTHAVSVRARARMNARVRPHTIGHERIETVGKSQTCMVSKLPIIYICVSRPYVTAWNTDRATHMHARTE